MYVSKTSLKFQKHYWDNFKFSKQLYLKNPCNGIKSKAFFIDILKQWKEPAKTYFLSFTFERFLFIKDKLDKRKYGTVIPLRNQRNGISKEELMEGAF